MAFNEFTVGKLYTMKQKAWCDRYRNTGGWIPFYEPRTDKLSQNCFYDDDPILILEKRYIVNPNTLIKAKNNGRTAKPSLLWHLKVLVDGEMGEVRLWDTDWKELK